MKRDNCFDFLRLLFALNVVGGHLFVIAVLPGFERFQHLFNTYLSVTGFFVISGFLIAQSYEHSSGLASYFTKRARRLLPAYWTVVLLCAVGLVGLSTLCPYEYFTSKDFWQYLGANICFLNFLHPSLPGVFDNAIINDNSVNPALWTLKIEITFYLFIPLLLWGLRKSKRAWVWLISIYILSITYKLGLEYLSDLKGIDFIRFLSRQLPGFMSYFSVGIAAYMYKDLFLKYKSYLIIPAVAVFIIENILGGEVLSPLAWGIIVLWAAYSLPALNNAAKYGDISYGAYIYHAPILKILLSLGVFELLGVIPATLIYLCLVILISFASWHLLEKKILKRS